jgi:hypothetical protein
VISAAGLATEFACEGLDAAAVWVEGLPRRNAAGITSPDASRTTGAAEREKIGGMDRGA